VAPASGTGVNVAAVSAVGAYAGISDGMGELLSPSLASVAVATSVGAVSVVEASATAVVQGSLAGSGSGSGSEAAAVSGIASGVALGVASGVAPDAASIAAPVAAVFQSGMSLVVVAPLSALSALEPLSAGG
jgi:hypothetical protein